MTRWSYIVAAQDRSELLRRLECVRGITILIPGEITESRWVSQLRGHWCFPFTAARRAGWPPGRLCREKRRSRERLSSRRHGIEPASEETHQDYRLWLSGAGTGRAAEVHVAEPPSLAEHVLQPF